LLRHFRCKILINDIVEKKLVTDTYGAIQVTKEDLIREADFISLHVPLTDLTHQLVNRSFLSQMKAPAFLINTSRGPVVEQAALKCCDKKQLLAQH
jgi:phosphoglycerate dehydrogenase-like enzyme